MLMAIHCPESVLCFVLLPHLLDLLLLRFLQSIALQLPNAFRFSHCLTMLDQPIGVIGNSLDEISKGKG
jgi:hypothetical protein